MAINYCVNCGEKLEDGATECAICGEAVPEALLAGAAASQDSPSAPEADSANGEAPKDDEAPTAPETEENTDAEGKTASESEEVVSPYADFSGFDVFNSNPAVAPAESLYPGPPDRTGVMAPVGGQRTVTEFRAPEEKKSYLTLPIKIAAAIAAAILVVAGVGLLAQPETQSTIQKQLEASSASSSAVIEDHPSSAPPEQATSSAEKPEETIADSKAVVDDDTAFEHLTSVYDSLQSYNERVYSCLQTYNGVVFTPDRSQREAAAGVAKSLLAEMEKDLKMLDSMNIGKASELYDDYENVRRLLNDQYQRLNAVCESWDINLTYDTPYEHENEILEPLRRDVGPSGVSTYLEDFDATYWESRPVR